MDDEEALRQCVVENMHKEDRDPLEEGELFHLWKVKTGKTYDEIARKLRIRSLEASLQRRAHPREPRRHVTHRRQGCDSVRFPDEAPRLRSGPCEGGGEAEG
jgi:hypothetical protein